MDCLVGIFSFDVHSECTPVDLAAVGCVDKRQRHIAAYAFRAVAEKITGVSEFYLNGDACEIGVDEQVIAVVEAEELNVAAAAGKFVG